MWHRHVRVRLYLLSTNLGVPTPVRKQGRGRACSVASNHHDPSMRQPDRALLRTKVEAKPSALTLTEAEADYFVKYGVASHIMAQCRNYRLFQIACQSIWISPPILHRQIEFFRSDEGRPIGYITWAYLAPDVENRLLTDPQFSLHISEWKEGANLWVIDLAAPHGRVKDFLREICQRTFSREHEINYVRRFQNGLVRKKVRIRNPFASPAEIGNKIIEK